MLLREQSCLKEHTTLSCAAERAHGGISVPLLRLRASASLASPQVSPTPLKGLFLIFFFSIPLMGDCYKIPFLPGWSGSVIER